MNLPSQREKISEAVVDPAVRFAAEIAEWAIGVAECKGFSVYHCPHDGNDATNCAINWTDAAILLSPLAPQGALLLWAFIHEIGHVLQGKPQKDKATRDDPATCRCEEDAWQKGWDAALQKFPKLESHSDQYWAEATKSLATYGCPPPTAP